MTYSAARLRQKLFLVAEDSSVKAIHKHRHKPSPVEPDCSVVQGETIILQAEFLGSMRAVGPGWEQGS